MENKNDMAIEINQLISTLAVDGDVVLKNQIANLSMVILNKKEHMKNLLASLNDIIDKM